MQKRFQIVKTERTADRDCLRGIPRPKLTVWVAADGSEDCAEIERSRSGLRPRHAHPLHQSVSCPGPHRHIYFEISEF